ncbi:uncharacterized protein G2W53_043198 [Senna tora]|uniref:Uncharacterized protein n=1 Tax=Senna tora TaxID=362788 RepID=A0A834SID2_9FABA|nr:uncharacterized protein G2W53_043198 [Senna tora]
MDGDGNELSRGEEAILKIRNEGKGLGADIGQDCQRKMQIW